MEDQNSPHRPFTASGELELATCRDVTRDWTRARRRDGRVLDAVGFELGRLLFFACCTSLEPALTTRADLWLCLDISAPLNTLDMRELRDLRCHADHYSGAYFEGALERP